MSSCFSSAASGQTCSEAAAPSMTLYTSESLKKAPSKLPFLIPPALAKFVSRPVLREAFRVLEMEGFVESRPGGGRYLRTEHIPKLGDIRRSRLENLRITLLQIWETREALEVKAAMLAARNASPTQLAEIELPLKLIKKLPITQYRQGDFNLDIHLAIAKASGNPLLENFIRDLLNRYREFGVKNLLELNSWASLQREHQPIFDAIAGRNPESAGQAMAAHFASLRKTLEKSSSGPKGGAV